MSFCHQAQAWHLPRSHTPCYPDVSHQSSYHNWFHWFFSRLLVWFPHHILVVLVYNSLFCDQRDRDPGCCLKLQCFHHLLWILGLLCYPISALGDGYSAWDLGFHSVKKHPWFILLTHFVDVHSEISTNYDVVVFGYKVFHPVWKFISKHWKDDWILGWICESVDSNEGKWGAISFKWPKCIFKWFLDSLFQCFDQQRITYTLVPVPLLVCLVCWI